MPLNQPSGHRLRRALGCALFCLVLSSPVLAENASTLTPDNLAVYAEMDETARVRILIDLAQSDAFDDAETLLRQYPLSGPHAANRTLFVEGLILRSRGDLTGAVAKFRAALADDPKLTLVRTELAKTLVALEQDDSAKHHLELLAADAPNADDAAGIRSFMDSIDQRRPYHFSAYVSMAPSTNINNGSGRSTVYSPVFGGDIVIDEDSRKKAGFGVSTGVSGSFNKRLGNDWSFIAAGGIDTRIYDDLEFNAFSLSQSIELRRMFERGYLGLGAVASQAFDVDESEIGSLSYGPRLSFRFNASPQNVFTGSSTLELRDFNADGERDGWASTTDLSLTHLIDSTASITAYGGFDYVHSVSDFQSYQTVSGGLNLYKELGHGLTVTTAGEVRFTTFEALNPIAGLVREDMRLIGGVTLTKRDFNILGFAPALNYTYVYNSSNIGLYDYDSHSVDFRLTKDF